MLAIPIEEVEKTSSSSSLEDASAERTRSTSVFIQGSRPRFSQAFDRTPQPGAMGQRQSFTSQVQFVAPARIFKQKTKKQNENTPSSNSSFKRGYTIKKKEEPEEVYGSTNKLNHQLKFSRFKHLISIDSVSNETIKNLNIGLPKHKAPPAPQPQLKIQIINPVTQSGSHMIKEGTPSFDQTTPMSPLKQNENGFQYIAENFGPSLATPKNYWTQRRTRPGMARTTNSSPQQNFSLPTQQSLTRPINTSQYLETMTTSKTSRTKREMRTTSSQFDYFNPSHPLKYIKPPEKHELSSKVLEKLALNPGKKMIYNEGDKDLFSDSTTGRNKRRHHTKMLAPSEPVDFQHTLRAYEGSSSTKPDPGYRLFKFQPDKQREVFREFSAIRKTIELTENTPSFSQSARFPRAQSVATLPTGSSPTKQNLLPIGQARRIQIEQMETMASKAPAVLPSSQTHKFKLGLDSTRSQPKKKVEIKVGGSSSTSNMRSETSSLVTSFASSRAPGKISGNLLNLRGESPKKEVLVVRKVELPPDTANEMYDASNDPYRLLGPKRQETFKNLNIRKLAKKTSVLMNKKPQQGLLQLTQQSTGGRYRGQRQSIFINRQISNHGEVLQALANHSSRSKQSSSNLDQELNFGTPILQSPGSVPQYTPQKRQQASSPISTKFSLPNSKGDFNVVIDQYYNQRRQSFKFSANVKNRQIIGTKDSLTTYMKDRYQKKVTQLIKTHTHGSSGVRANFKSVSPNKQQAPRHRKILFENYKGGSKEKVGSTHDVTDAKPKKKLRVSMRMTFGEIQL